MIFFTITVLMGLMDEKRTRKAIKENRPKAQKWINQRNANFAKLKELQYKQY